MNEENTNINNNSASDNHAEDVNRQNPVNNAEPVKEDTPQQTNETSTSSQNTETVNTQTASTENQPGTGTAPVSPKKPLTITVEGKKKHTITGKKILQYIIIFVICGLCGFGGGWLAYDARAQKDQPVSSQENSQENMPQFRGDFGGFPGQSETDNTSAALGVLVRSSDDGVVVEGFSDNSKAESAGIQTGDIIEKLDGTSVSSIEEIKSFLSGKKPGDTVKITVLRDQEEKDVNVELVESSSFSSGSESSGESHTLPGNDSSDTYTG